MDMCGDEAAGEGYSVGCTEPLLDVVMHGYSLLAKANFIAWDGFKKISSSSLIKRTHY